MKKTGNIIYGMVLTLITICVIMAIWNDNLSAILGWACALSWAINAGIQRVLD